MQKCNINEDLYLKLSEQGWISIDANGISLLEFAPLLGKSISSRKNSTLIDILTPTTTEDARKGSLSSKVGKNAMPFHTDCAYYEVPPRYLLLQAEIINNDCATLLIDFTKINFSHDELSLLKEGIWFCRGQNNRFLASILNSKYMRWDENCMFPQENVAHQGKELLLAKLKDQKPYRHIWGSTEKILVIDNWRVLHSREPSQNEKRRLKRVLVEDQNVEI